MTVTTIQHVTTICSFQNGVMRRKVSYFKALSGDDVYNFHGGFGVLDIWNILVGGREIFFFCSHWVVGQSVAVWKTACCSPGPPQMFQHNKVTSHVEAKVFMGMCHLFVV